MLRLIIKLLRSTYSLISQILLTIIEIVWIVVKNPEFVVIVIAISAIFFSVLAFGIGELIFGILYKRSLLEWLLSKKSWGRVALGVWIVFALLVALLLTPSQVSSLEAQLSSMLGHVFGNKTQNPIPATTLTATEVPLPTREADAWSAAQQADTIDDYEIYLGAFPAGSHADEARRRIAAHRESQAKALATAREADAWSATQQADTIDDYEIYLGTFPTGSHADEARGRIAAHRDSQTKALATAREADAWSVAQQVDTIEAYERLLSGFPNGIHANDAHKKLDDLRSRARASDIAKQDEDAWGDVKQSGTLDAYQTYLSRFPNGSHAEDAKAKINIIQKAKDEEAWKAAQDTGTAEACGGYLKDHPAGAHVVEARNCVADAVAKARDEADWRVALAAMTPAACQKYLKDHHADGAHIDDALKCISIPPIDVRNTQMCNYNQIPQPDVMQEYKYVWPYEKTGGDAYRAFIAKDYKKAFDIAMKIDREGVIFLNNYPKDKPYYYFTIDSAISSLAIERARIATIYRMGEVRDPNNAEAVKWYHKAFNTTFEVAQYGCHLEGLPAPVNRSVLEYTASYLYGLGVSKNNEYAKSIINYHYSDPNEATKALIESIETNSFPKTYEEFKNKYID